MMYSEFIEGTGCKENEHNYKVYKDLEIMYMNSNMSKEQIYEYGKKLVDNSKSKKQIELENEFKAKINEYKEIIKEQKSNVDFYKQVNDLNSVKYYMNEIKYYKNRIKELKWILQC